MIKSSPPPLKRAFTLIELLVVIATITILAAVAIPVFKSVFESAKATKDTSNLRQLGAATQMYMNDNNGVSVLDEQLMDVANKPKILLEMGSVSVSFRQAHFVGSREFKHASQLWRQPERLGTTCR